MRVNPNRLATAITSIYGTKLPRRNAALLHFPCDRCRGRRQTLTVCPDCGGRGRVMVVA